MCIFESFWWFYVRVFTGQCFFVTVLLFTVIISLCKTKRVLIFRMFYTLIMVVRWRLFEPLNCKVIWQSESKLSEVLWTQGALEHLRLHILWSICHCPAWPSLPGHRLSTGLWIEDQCALPVWVLQGWGHSLSYNN